MKEELKESNEIMEFLRKLNVLFSYYNELGDEFSFFNSEGKEEFISNEIEINITVYMNIIMIGESGSGKSTLINLILGEKKALEGGSGLSTTSKNIIIYKKSDIPLRLYNIKGNENEETVTNYINIFKDFNGNNNFSLDKINAIFYCIEYANGTIIKQMENKLFEELVEYNIPIFFIITKSVFNPSKKCENEKQKKEREDNVNRIEKVIKGKIKNIFENKKKEKEESEEFIKNFINFKYVNLVARYDTDIPIPVFGIDKVLSFFKKSVPNEDWEELVKACIDKDEKRCQQYCIKNPFLKNYSEFQKIRENNKNEAIGYLSKLKYRALISGMIPGVDIGMEYLYKYQFLKKLKSLYGYDFYKATENIKDINNHSLIKNEKENNDQQKLISNITELESSLDKISSINDVENDDDSLKINDDKIKDNSNHKEKEEKEEEKDFDEKFKETENNAFKNTISFFRGLGEAGSIVLKVLPTAGRITLETGEVIIRTGISVGLKIVSWVSLPITCFAFAYWSRRKIDQDCSKILDIFDEAFIPNKFSTLLAYIYSFLLSIEYLDIKGKKLIPENK